MWFHCIHLLNIQKAMAPTVAEKGNNKRKKSGSGGAKPAKAARSAPKDRNAAPVPRERVPLRQAPKPIATNIGASKIPQKYKISHHN